MARGVAHARRDGPYLLNVPAGRMAASSVDPLEFLTYARRALPNATAEDFLPREYGHRYRLPPCTWSALNELRRRGRLVVHAGRVLDMDPLGRRVTVTWRAGGTSTATTMLVDRVVNCIVPQYDVRHTRERLLRALLARRAWCCRTRSALGS